MLSRIRGGGIAQMHAHQEMNWCKTVAKALAGEPFDVCTRLCDSERTAAMSAHYDRCKRTGELNAVDSRQYLIE